MKDTGFRGQVIELYQSVTKQRRGNGGVSGCTGNSLVRVSLTPSEPPHLPYNWHVAFSESHLSCQKPVLATHGLTLSSICLIKSNLTNIALKKPSVPPHASWRVSGDACFFLSSVNSA